MYTKVGRDIIGALSLESTPQTDPDFGPLQEKNKTGVFRRISDRDSGLT